MGAATQPTMATGYTDKQTVRVITVDKDRRRVECAMRDGAMVYAAVWEVPTVFRWPKTGEVWTIRKDTGVWRLDGLVENLDITASNIDLSSLSEGETRILGESSLTGSGVYLGAHEGARKVSFDIGDGSQTVWEINHRLGTPDITIAIRAELRQTILTSSIAADADPIEVVSTDLFDTSGILYVEDEKIYYEGSTGTSFTTLTRGYEGTTASIHLEGVTLSQPAPEVFTDTKVIDKDRIRLTFKTAPTSNQYRVTITG